ncbi:MAG: hypothetical protein ACI4KR_07475 [Ruminiclostridium sp.]
MWTENGYRITLPIADRTMFGGRVTLFKEDYGALTDLAKKQIAAENSENSLVLSIKVLDVQSQTLIAEKKSLTEQNAKLKEENGYLNRLTAK